MQDCESESNILCPLNQIEIVKNKKDRYVTHRLVQ